ncbi:MAG: hypothetical protein U0165_01160 [Polyangiaceae bacterium]
MAVLPSKELRMSRSPSCIGLRALRTCLTSTFSVLALGGLSAGCLDRPLAPSSPRTSNAVTDEVKISKVDKIDLLFMIDNSASMGDKQDILSFAVPDLVNRLVDPDCFDDTGTKQAKVNGSCPAGSAPEFDPILDIHIGVVTSSLGGHGADICTEDAKNDKGEMITRGKDLETGSAVTPTGFYKNSGFFAWDASQPPRYPGESTFSDATQLATQFKYVVGGAGESGCGYEASLEAWYRFLVDPVPPASVPALATEKQYTSAVPQGVDDNVYTQRGDFLRPDSLVAVILLSDENDCSLADGPIPDNGGFPGQIFLRQGANNDFLLRPGTAACADAPYSEDCTSCFLFNDPADPKAAGCFDGTTAKTLSKGNSTTKGEDPANLRCWNQKQRFGIDGLYPTDRYTNGLTEPIIYGRKVDANGNTFTNSDGSPVADQIPYFNPLLVAGWADANKEVRDLVAKNLSADAFNAEFKKLQTKYLTTSAVRDNNLVFFATIVGVPWQDIARDPADLTQGFRPVKDFETKLSELPKDGDKDRAIAGADFTTWDLILGDPFGKASDANGKTTPPVDPLMLERRDQIQNKQHPITKETIGGSGTWNSINGQEWNPITDLQYACILPLRKTVDCSTASCVDCGGTTETEATLQNPLCNADGAANSTYDNTRRRAKAYPGTRFLQVLKDFNNKVNGNGIGASICAKNVDDNTKDDYGYRPAVAAIIDRLKSQLSGRCYERALSVTQVPNKDNTSETLPSAACLIIEASDPKDADHTKPSTDCKCDGKGETPVSSEINSVLVGAVKDDFFCRCELTQFEGNALKLCQTDPSSNLSLNGQAISGWCYVDPANAKDDASKAAADKIVEKCDENSKHTIRFINLDTSSSTLFITCLGAAAGTQ